MLWIVFLRAIHGVRVSVWWKGQILHLIRTWGLKATVYVCTSCTVVSLSTTDVKFQHSSSHVDCNFDARLVSKKRKRRYSTKKLRKHVCQLILVQTVQSVQSRLSKRSPMAREQSQPGPDTTGICALCHRAFMDSCKSSRQVRRQSVFTKLHGAYCHCFAPLPLLSWFVHREKCPNSSTIHWFNSACTSVSMFTINVDNCHFLCFWFPSWARPVSVCAGCSPPHHAVECGIHGQ